MASLERDIETIKQTGAYNLPTDSREGNRLDNQHILFGETFSGRLFFSPLDQPTAILDIGCGTSAWGINAARQFPQAQVTGLDLGHYPPHESQPNYEFISGNFEQPWSEALSSSPSPAKFDLIHARFVIVAMKDHRRVIAQAFEHLKPGGWFELQELEIPSPAEGNTPEFQRWGELMQEASLKMGRNLQAALSWEDWLKEAGYANIHHEYFKWPLGAPEHGSEEEKKLGELSGKNFYNGLEGFSRINFATKQGLGWDEDKFQAYLKDFRAHYLQNQGKSSLPIHVIYGQKPVD